MKKTISFYVLKKQLRPLLYLFLVLSTLACEKDRVDDKETMEDKAPLFSLASLDNGTVNLADYENKVVVLYFFGSSCPNCIAAGPDIEKKLQTPFAANDDYAIIGLDQWNGNNAAVESFKSRTGITFPLLLNAAGVATEYKTTYDRLIVLNKKREVVFKGSQLAGSDLAAAEAKVLELVTPKTDNTTSENKAPLFSLASLDNGTVNLADYENKVVVLYFFGSECPNCIAAGPDIEKKLQTPFAANDDYAIIGLDVWDKNNAAVESFKSRTGITFPLLLNASGVAAEYKTAYDRLIVLNKKREVVFKGSQLAGSDLAAAEAKVLELVTPKTDNTTSENKAPLFSLASLDNGTVNLADYENKVVVLYFFGSSCPFCIAAGPDIEKKLQTAFAANDDYAIIGLDQWNGNNAAVESFKSRTGITFPLLLKAAGVAAEYKTTYDRLIVLNKKREVVFKGSQLAGRDLGAVEAKVNTLLSN